MLTLAEHRHFGKAAAALNVTQPTVSRGIQSLEKSLGTRLFERKRQQLEPTLAGRLVIERAKSVLMETVNIREEIQRLTGSRAGYLRVSFSQYTYEMHAGPAAREMAEAHPGLHLQYSLRNFRGVMGEVAANNADLGVADISEAEGDASMSTELLGTHQLHLFCRPGHPLFDRSEVHLEEILNFPLTRGPTPKRMEEQMPGMAKRAGLHNLDHQQFLATLDMPTPGLMREVATHSDAIGASPLILLEEDLKAGRLALLRTVEPFLRLHYGVMYRKGRRLPPSAVGFIDSLKRIEAEVARRELELTARYGAPA